MTEAKQPEALRLAEQSAWTGHWYYAGCGTVHCTYGKPDAEHDEIAHPCPVGVAEYIAAANPSAVLALLDLIAELEQQLVAEAAKTAAEKLRADQMTEQHRMQAAMHAQATERPPQCLHGISEPSGWRDIETAPKDGTEILLSNGEAVDQGWWMHREGGITEYRDLDGQYIYQTEDEGYIGWWDVGGGMLPEPTHWMPMPSPSSADEGGSE